MRKIRKKNIKKNLHIIILCTSILSILLFKIQYISIIIALVSLITTIIFCKNYKKILIITLIISIIMIIINSISIYKDIKIKTDVYKDINILLGSWTYNEYGGKYVFNKDNTYIQYTNSDTTDNYCKGTYKYHYGATNDKNITMRQDKNYYYYTLNLKEEYCLIMNKKFYDEYTKSMVFGIDKLNESKITMLNKENNNTFTMTKEKNK